RLERMYQTGHHQDQLRHRNQRHVRPHHERRTDERRRNRPPQNLSARDESRHETGHRKTECLRLVTPLPEKMRMTDELTDARPYVDALLARAVNAAASDLHIEPTAAGADIKLRI